MNVEDIINGTPVHVDSKSITILVPNMTLQDYAAVQVLPTLIAHDTDPTKHIAENTRISYLYGDAVAAEKEKRNDHRS